MENLKIIETFRKDKKFILILAVLSALSFGIVSLAWPIFAGRDTGSFFTYFYWLFEPETPFRMLMSYRTILSSSIIGLLLLAGRTAIGVFLFCAYLLCNLSFYYLGCFFNKKVGRFFSIVMLLDLPLTIFFHEFSSDIILLIFLVFWSVYFIRIVDRWNAPRAVILGLATFSLALVRPITQIFALVCLTPIVLNGFKRKNIILAGVFLAAYLAGSLAYSTYNYERYGSFAVSRGSNFIIPGYKAFIQDKILAPGNGPASRKLAQAVKGDLLDKPVYQKAKIDLNKFFSSGNPSMFFDLVNLSDRTWGWNDNYRVIRQATMEAILKHPLKFLAGSLKNIFAVSIENYVPAVPEVKKNSAVAANGAEAVSVFDDFYVWWPTSGSAKTETEIAPVGWVSRMSEKLGNRFPPVSGNKNIGLALSRVDNLFPFVLFFVVFAFFLVNKLEDKKNRIILTMFVPALLCAVIPIATINSYAQFRLPFDFIFILAGIIGFFSSVKMLALVKNFLPLGVNGVQTGEASGRAKEVGGFQEGDSHEYPPAGKETLESLDNAKNFTSWLFFELKPYFQGKNILEIGSGTGVYSEKIINNFPDSKIFLSDIDSELSAIIREKFKAKENVSFIKINIADKEDFFPLQECLDTVVAINVLEHVKDDENAFKHVYSSLKKGGRFIVLVPAHKALYNIIDRSIGHYRRYTKEELAAKAAAAGFKVSKIFYFNFFSIFGWYLNGNILKKNSLDSGFLKIFDFLVPIFGVLEKNIFRGKIGISLIIILEK
jgi:SAM-dependent methyltransferase